VIKYHLTRLSSKLKEWKLLKVLRGSDGTWRFSHGHDSSNVRSFVVPLWPALCETYRDCDGSNVKNREKVLLSLCLSFSLARALSSSRINLNPEFRAVEPCPICDVLVNSVVYIRSFPSSSCKEIVALARPPHRAENLLSLSLPENCRVSALIKAGRNREENECTIKSAPSRCNVIDDWSVCRMD